MKIAYSIALLLSILMPIPFSGAPLQEGTTVRDKDIKIVDFDDLTYPAPARTAHVQGVVVVRANLSDRGEVTEATAISGDEVLIPACLVNIKKWRFQPNTSKTVVIVYTSG